MPFLIVLVVIVLVIIVANIKIVPQAHEFVIEFLGKYKTTWSAGFHIKVPLFERISKKVTLKEQVLDSPPQPVITKDNVTMQIDTVIYYAVYDAKLYAYGAVNPISAIIPIGPTKPQVPIPALTPVHSSLKRQVAIGPTKADANVGGIQICGFFTILPI